MPQLRIVRYTHRFEAVTPADSCGWEARPALLEYRRMLRLIRWAAPLGVLVAWGLFAKEPQFSDISALFPELTNNSKASPPAQLQTATTNVLASGSTNSMDALDDNRKLVIGDRLSFRIVEDEEDPRPLFVTDSGELELPYIGRFPAVGKSCKELAREIKAELEQEYYYQATVIVAVDSMRTRGKVYLVGSVRAPGPQEIPSDEVFTLSKAILRAGGFTEIADQHNVKVMRKGGSRGKDQKLIVNVKEILEKGKTASDLTLEPGDLIFINERMIRL